jgi:O-antigen ligase
MTRRVLAGIASAAALVGVSVAGGVLVASTLPFATRAVAATALVAAFSALAIWARTPAIAVGGFLFALPLLERRDVFAGLDPGELVTLILVLLGALALFLEPPAQVRQRMQLILWALVGLAFVGGISIADNGLLNPTQVAAAVLKPAAWAIVIYLVLVYFDSESKLRGLLLTLIASGAAAGAIGVIQFVTGHAPVSPGDSLARADGTFEHYNQLGGFMALMSVPTLAYALSTRRGALKILLFTALLVELTALLLSGTLGSLLGLLVAALISVRLWSVRPVVGLVMTTLPLLALVSLALLAPAQADRIGLVGQRANDRLRTYAAGLAVARDHLWFGTGSDERTVEEIENNPNYGFTRFGETGSQPHNVFLEALVITGLPGLLLLAWLVWLVLRILMASRPKPEEKDYLLRWGIILGCIAFLVQNLTNTLLTHARIGVIFLTLVVIAARLAALRIVGDEETATVSRRRSGELRDAISAA